MKSPHPCPLPEGEVEIWKEAMKGQSLAGRGSVLRPVMSFIIDGKLKKVTLDQVLKGVDRPRRPVLRVMDYLVKIGNLCEVADHKTGSGYGEFGPPRRNPVWEVVKPLQLPTLSPQRRTIRDRIWQAIRMKKRFCLGDIITITEADEGSVRLYVRMLTKAGYLRVISKNGVVNTYMLFKSKDCGPKRPALTEPKKTQPSTPLRGKRVIADD